VTYESVFTLIEFFCERMRDAMPDLVDFAAMARQEAEEGAEDLRKYHEGYLRGDTEMMYKAAKKLGKSVADVKADAAVFEQAAALELKAADDNAELTAALQPALDASTAYREETGRIVREREREEKSLWAEVMALQRHQAAAREAGRELVVLRQRHWALFGESPPAPEPAPQAIMLRPSLIGQPPEARPAVMPIHQPRMVDGVLTWGPRPDEPAATPATASVPAAATAVAETVPPAGDEDDGGWPDEE
jgi:hypothetical protein